MSSYWLQAIPLIMVFAIFYCVAIRPGRVAEGKRYAVVTAMKGSERVLTSHGMYGSVVRVHRFPPASKGLDDQMEFDIEISPGVAIRVKQEGIKEILQPQVSESIEASSHDIS